MTYRGRVQVESIRIYPIKGTAPVHVSGREVELAGLRSDRRWAVLDPDGRRLNATTHNVLLQVTATVGDAEDLTLHRDGQSELVVPVPVHGPRVPIGVSRLNDAVDAGDAAAEWLSEALGERVRLAWQDDTNLRPMSAKHGGHGHEPLSLADTGPILLTTRESMDQLNEWVADGPEPDPLPMDRFRPNVVVTGTNGPYVEDAWQLIRIGSVTYRFAEWCDRCSITLINRTTLKHGKEPIRTLARHRRWDNKTWFGVRIVPLQTGTIRVEDPVVVLD